MPSTKEDKALLSMLPVVVMWIKQDTDLSEQEIRTVAKLHPTEFEFAQRTPASDMMAFVEKYRSHRLYRDLIEVVVSDQGWNWVLRTVEKCKRMPPLVKNSGHGAFQKRT